MRSLKYDPPTFWNERCKKFGHTGWADRLYYHYDQPLRLKAIEKVLSLTGITIEDKRTKVLDVGCGTGDLIQILADKGANVFGIDISTEAIKIAKARFRGNNRVQLIVGSIEKLDDYYPSEFFDLVTSITVLQHIVDVEAFLTAVHKIVDVVKRGGHILLLETAPYRNIKSDFPSYISVRTRQEWIDVFEEAGCQLIKEFAYPQWGLSLLRKIEKIPKRIWKKRGNTSDKMDTGASRKLLHVLYDGIRWFILKFTYPLDHLLFVPFPSRKAEYRIFIFKKTKKKGGVSRDDKERDTNNN